MSGLKVLVSVFCSNEEEKKRIMLRKNNEDTLCFILSEYIYGALIKVFVWKHL